MAAKRSFGATWHRTQTANAGFGKAGSSHAERGGFPHEINLRRGQAVGLVCEVAEGALQFQGFGGEGAGGLDGADVFVPESVKAGAELVTLAGSQSRRRPETHRRGQPLQSGARNAKNAPESAICSVRRKRPTTTGSVVWLVPISTPRSAPRRGRLDQST